MIKRSNGWNWVGFVMVSAMLMAGRARADVAPAGAEATAGHRIRVACVGDSITMGIGTKVPASQGYPAQLQAILGTQWEVLNFGVGGRTLLRKADPLALGRALKSNPDVVVIMLGTNDSKTNTWAVHKSEFIGDYVEVIRQFQALASKPKVLVCLPVPAFPGNWGISETIIVSEIMPAIREAARTTGVTVIDAHTPLMDAKALFPDKVHPNQEGARRIAEIVAGAVKGLK